MAENKLIIQQIDISDYIQFINRKNKFFQSSVLSELESVVTDEEEYKIIRKLVLDGFSNYTRSIVRLIFGTDYEGIVK